MKNFINEYDRVKKEYAQFYGTIKDLCRTKILEYYKSEPYVQAYADTFNLYDTKIENDEIKAYITIDIDGFGHLKFHEFTFTNEDFNIF